MQEGLNIEIITLEIDKRLEVFGFHAESKNVIIHDKVFFTNVNLSLYSDQSSERHKHWARKDGRGPLMWNANIFSMHFFE